MICNFPSCIQGWLDVRDINNEDIQIDDLKSADMISVSNWKPQFCILMENDSKLYVFDDEPNLQDFPIPDHIEKCRLDSELNSNQMSDSCSCLDDVSTISSKNHDSDRYNSNSSLSHISNSKQYVKSGLFRNSSRLFRRVKSNNKLNSSTSTGKDGNFESIPPTKSVSTLKRSLSLSRLNRKKSEEKSDSKSPRSTMKNNQYMTQSTGDLTMNVTSVCVARHNLKKDSIIADVHPSLVGERAHCFSVTSLAVELNSDSNFDGKTKDLVLTKRIFAAKSLLEKQCWMRRLQQTLKPNYENENRMNNMLKLTISESKFLPTQKRRYFCEVSLDKILFARTTSKISNSEGCVFWAEDLVLNNLPNFKNLSINIYKEPDPVKDSKKKKRKHLNQCIGCVNFNIANLSSKNEFESWFPIKSVDLLPDLNTNPIQLRVKIRYQTLKVLKMDSYEKLAQIATHNYLELILFLEKNLPVKLKEEIANCLVNIHESNGTIIEFLTDLISQEINDLDNSSMTLRANTIVTKIIEGHMKLVGSQYLHSMLHSFIRDVMYKNVTIEVDSSRINFGSENPDKVILDNQHRLVEYLKHIWYKIYDSKNRNFPKQLKLIFTGWRKILESASKAEDRQKTAAHCDVIVSGCIFLRLLCPAILSPHLFGLVSHFSDNKYVQRTLTLIAKSLQSLANFSHFGDKEHFMIFLNKCFEEEIPRMHEFLRSISSVSNDGTNSLEELQFAVEKEVKFYGSTIDLSLELARLHHCLASDIMKDYLNKSPKIQNILKLPDIVREINHQLSAYHPQSTQSFFSYKKTQTSSSSINDQRRSSLGPLINSRIQDLGRNDKDNSPPRLGSPICQSTSAVDPISEYGVHASNEVWQLRSDANCSNNSKLSRTTTVNPIVYSTKQQYTVSPIPKSQMNVASFHKGHYNTRETDDNQNFGENSHRKLNDVNNTNYSPVSQHNQHKSSIPKSILSQNKRISSGSFMPPPKIPPSKPQEDSHYAKVNDVLDFDVTKWKFKSMTSPPQVESENNDLYRENPLYDCFDVSLRATPESDRYPQNTIDRYFTVRSHVSLLEQQLKQSNMDSNKNQNLHDLRQEMENIKLEVQNEQLKDLKQLKQMVSFNKNNSAKKMYSSLTNAPFELTNAVQKDVTHQAMTETLDEVIHTITIEGTGLEEAQINLRRQHLKKDRHNKTQSSTTRPRQQSLGTIFSMNNDGNLQAVPIEFTESAPPISSLASTPVKSQSSSNCSSMTPWLI